MPKIVDWDERRDEILSATWRVIARNGIAGATREVEVSRFHSSRCNGERAREYSRAGTIVRLNVEG